MSKRQKFEADTKELVETLKQSKSKGLDALFPATPPPSVLAEKTKEAVKPARIAKEKETVKQVKKAPAKVREIRLTLPLPADYVSFLDQMERDIFVRRPLKHRSKQRLTKNSIVRAWLALLQEFNIDINSIMDEDDLYRRLKKAVINKTDEVAKV